MTLSTIKGRVQTKLLTFVWVLPLAFIVATIEDCTVYYTMFALMGTIGILLEVIYGSFVDHEPGWLTILFGVIEFSIIFGIIKYFQLDLIISFTPAEFIEGIRFYLIAWGMTQLILLYLLPVLRPTWIQDGGELW